LKARTILTSSFTTSGFFSKSGFAAIPGLLPTDGPPLTMMVRMWSSSTEACQAASVKLRGFGFSAAAPAPSPCPVSPWHTEQRTLKMSFAAVTGFSTTGAGGSFTAVAVGAGFSLGGEWHAGVNTRPQASRDHRRRKSEVMSGVICLTQSYDHDRRHAQLPRSRRRETVLATIH